MRDQRPKMQSLGDEAFKFQRGDRKEPIVRLDTLEICHPISVVAQVIAFEPALRGFLEIRSVFGFASFSLLSPMVIEFLRVENQPVFFGPTPECLLFLWPDKIVYFVPSFVALADCGRIRVLPRLIRSYCLMASVSDCFRRLDKSALACSCCCRWNSFR